MQVNNNYWFSNKIRAHLLRLEESGIIRDKIWLLRHKTTKTSLSPSPRPRQPLSWINSIRLWMWVLWFAAMNIRLLTLPNLATKTSSRATREPASPSMWTRPRKLWPPIIPFRKWLCQIRGVGLELELEVVSTITISISSMRGANRWPIFSRDELVWSSSWPTQIRTWFSKVEGTIISRLADFHSLIAQCKAGLYTHSSSIRIFSRIIIRRTRATSLASRVAAPPTSTGHPCRSITSRGK